MTASWQMPRQKQKKIMDNASKNATLEEQKRIEQAQEQIAGLVVEATAKLVAPSRTQIQTENFTTNL